MGQYHASSPQRQANPVRKYLVPEITYNFCAAGVPDHLLELWIGAPVMDIRNEIHPKVFNEKLFTLKYYKRWAFYVEYVHGED